MTTAVRGKDFQLLVFDWDGTLVDSEGRIVACMEAAFQDLDLTPLPRDQLRDVIGLGLAEAVARLLPRADESLRRRFVERYRHHYLARSGAPTPLFPGARRTLERLAADGYLLAVATGKSRRGLARSLEETGCAHLFAVTRCADECFSKPHPQMLQEIMTDLDTPPERTLMIGDTEYDLLMARNAGVPRIGVSYGVHGRERLLRHAPLVCLDRIEALPPWLEGQDDSRGQGPGQGVE